jgi:hypothetical protein
LFKEVLWQHDASNTIGEVVGSGVDGGGDGGWPGGGVESMELGVEGGVADTMWLAQGSILEAAFLCLP